MGRLVRGLWWREAALAAATLGVVQVALWLYLRHGFATLAGVGSDDLSVHLDFDIFRHSALAWLEGSNPFRDTGAPDLSNNPPIWTVLFVPLALLEPLEAYRLWVLVLVLVQVVALAWVSKELRLDAGWAVVVACGLLVSEPLLGTLRIGQMYTVLTLGLVAAWILDRRDRSVASGVALALVGAIKPSLAPVVLWPLLRRRWQAVAATAVSGTAVTLVGVLAVGIGPTLDWLTVLRTKSLDGNWDNASLPGLASRTFRENNFTEPLFAVPWAISAALALGIALLVLTLVKVGRDPDFGLWSLVAASLLASPIAWYYYLPILTPGVFILLSHGRKTLAILLVVLVLIPQSWMQL